MKFPNFRLDGILAAPCTGLKPNGDINPDVVDKYVDYLVQDHVDGVFLLGTMGEGLSFTVEERKQIAETWVAAGKNKLKYIVLHIGAGNIRDSIELARHAESLGVTAIACVSPTFFKPKDEDAIVSYLAEVAAAAPNTPFYYYDINFITGVYLNAARVLDLAKDRIPTLVGLKFSSQELPVLYDCKELDNGRFHVMIGTDEAFLPALSLGIEVPILNGYLGGIFKRTKDAFDQKDLVTARKEQKYARKLMVIRKRWGNGGPDTVKSMMKFLGLDLGPVRLPLVSLTTEQEEGLRKELDDAGFFK